MAYVVAARLDSEAGRTWRVSHTLQVWYCRQLSRILVPTPLAMPVPLEEVGSIYIVCVDVEYRPYANLRLIELAS